LIVETEVIGALTLSGLVATSVVVPLGPLLVTAAVTVKVELPPVVTEAGLKELCAFLGLGYEPGMVEYGSAEDAAPKAGRGLGDPITVNRESRPTTGSIAKWAEALRADPARLAQCRTIAERLADEDLALWGTPGPELRKTLAELVPAGAGAPRPALTRYTLERRLLVLLRRNIHHNAFGRLVRRVRTVCDVLLR
jgi:hypothetical protein